MQTVLKIPIYELENDKGIIENPLVKVEVTDEVSYRNNQIFFSPHRKNFYVLLYVIRGQGRHWIDTVPYDFKPRTIYFTSPQQVHLKEDAAVKAVRISFTPEFLSLRQSSRLAALPVIQNRVKRNSISLTFQEHKDLHILLNRMVEEGKSQLPWQQEILFAYLTALLIFLSRLYIDRYGGTTLSNDRTHYLRFMSCLEANYKRIHEVGKYAQTLNVSEDHLYNIVKGESGKSVIIQIHERLLLEAKRILFHTENSIKETAFELGFKDASYFNRFFRRATGRTPLEYRLTSREMYH